MIMSATLLIPTWEIFIMCSDRDLRELIVCWYKIEIRLNFPSETFIVSSEKLFMIINIL